MSLSVSLEKIIAAAKMPSMQ